MFFPHNFYIFWDELRLFIQDNAPTAVMGIRIGVVGNVFPALTLFRELRLTGKQVSPVAAEELFPFIAFFGEFRPSCEEPAPIHAGEAIPFIAKGGAVAVRPIVVFTVFTKKPYPWIEFLSLFFPHNFYIFWDELRLFFQDHAPSAAMGIRIGVVGEVFPALTLFRELRLFGDQHVPVSGLKFIPVMAFIGKLRLVDEQKNPRCNNIVLIPPNVSIYEIFPLVASIRELRLKSK